MIMETFFSWIWVFF